jgi:hypothetical protein
MNSYPQYVTNYLPQSQNSNVSYPQNYSQSNINIYLAYYPQNYY